ncbi:MAG: hypothetical protein NVSMB48_05180 [Marmoricola sp.]
MGLRLFSRRWLTTWLRLARSWLPSRVSGARWEADQQPVQRKREASADQRGPEPPGDVRLEVDVEAPVCTDGAGMNGAHLTVADPCLGATDADHLDGQEAGADEAGGRGLV